MSENALSILDTVEIQQIGGMMATIKKFQAVVNQTLVSGHDYDTIPGTNKPTLLKPGAEKILMLLGLTSEYRIIEQVEDYDKGIFAYTVQCVLSKGSTKITDGLGSCNSKEDKYRWRWVKEEELPPGMDKDNLKSRTTKYGSVQYRIENDEIYSQANTILKMAKKRAQIDATLTVAALSEVFTQDLEDMRVFLQQEEIDNMKPDEVGNIKINFGKHKGQTLAEIAKQDISYIEWIAEKGRDESMRKAAGLLLNGSPEPRKDVRVTPKDSAPQTPPPPTEPPTQENIKLPWDEGGKINGK
jgi:hypothetical protein